MELRPLLANSVSWPLPMNGPTAIVAGAIHQLNVREQCANNVVHVDSNKTVLFNEEERGHHHIDGLSPSDTDPNVTLAN